MQRGESRTERVGHARLEPAVGARTHTSQDGAALPRRPQCLVDSVQSPEREGVRRVPAGYVDHVLGRELLGRAVQDPEEPQTTGLAVAGGEGLEERGDPAVRVAGWGRDQTHARAQRVRQGEHERVERRIGLCHEPTAAHREDVAAHVFVDELGTRRTPRTGSLASSAISRTGTCSGLPSAVATAPSIRLELPRARAVPQARARWRCRVYDRPELGRGIETARWLRRIGDWPPGRPPMASAQSYEREISV